MSKSGFILLATTIYLHLTIAKKITCPTFNCKPESYWEGTIRQDLCY